MKRIVELLLGLMSLLVIVDTVQAQESEEGRADVVSVQTGYTNFSLTNLHTRLDNMIDYYGRYYHLPVQKVTEFPGNWIVGGAYAWHAAMPIWLKLGGYYTQTMGKIGYRDVNGTLSEEIRAHIVYLNAGAQFNLKRRGATNIFLALRAGLLKTTIETRDAIEFYRLSEFNEASSSTLRSTRMAYEIGTGFETRVLGTAISLECGYRIDPQSAKNSFGEDFTDDFSGLIVTSTLGIPISW